MDAATETAPLRTSHIVLRAADLARSEKFYRDLFGFTEIARDAPAGDTRERVYLGLDGVTMLAFEPSADPAAPRPRVEPEPFIGMEHFAFELAPDEFATLQAFWRRLREMGVMVHHTVDHLITHSIYFLDPARNLIEAYINCPRERYASGRWREHPYGSFQSLDDALDGKAPPPIGEPSGNWQEEMKRREGR